MPKRLANKALKAVRKISPLILTIPTPIIASGGTKVTEIATPVSSSETLGQNKFKAAAEPAIKATAKYTSGF